MRTRTFAIGSVFALAGIASADLLHDNYPANSYNSTKYLSAEKNTQVSDSWVVDDATFASEVRVEALEWIGYRQIKSGSKNLTYGQAEYSIRTRTGSPGSYNFTLVAGASQATASYTTTSLGLFQNGTYELYSGTLTLPVPIDLAEDEPYWFGIRLVGDASNQFLGRNFLVAANSQIGIDEGFTYNAEGWNGWLPASSMPNFPEKTDFAFRVHGVVIPEPSSLMALLVMTGLALAGRRA